MTREVITQLGAGQKFAPADYVNVARANKSLDRMRRRGKEDDADKVLEYFKAFADGMEEANARNNDDKGDR